MAGSFIRDGSSYAYIRSHGSFRLLGKGVANGINSLGQVVGVSSVTNHATLWKHGHALDLGTLSGDRAVALVSIATELWSVTTAKLLGQHSRGSNGRRARGWFRCPTLVGCALRIPA